MIARTPDTCVRCGYDLRGIANDQPCPECGLLAERSRRPSERLRDARPEYLRKLAIGLWMILVGCGLGVAWPIFVLNAAAMGWADPGWFATPEMALATASVGGGAIVLVGVWLLTATEPAQTWSWRQVWLRCFAAVPVLYGLVVFLIAWLAYKQTLNSSGSFRFRWAGVLDEEAFYDRLYRWWIGSLGIAAYMLVPILIIPLPALLFAHLGRLGRRLLSRQLTEHSYIVGLGLSFTIVLVAAAVWFAQRAPDWFGSTWASRSQSALAIAVSCMTVIGLFVLWTAYLLMRFAIAFGMESRALKRAWREADRSDSHVP